MDFIPPSNPRASKEFMMDEFPRIKRLPPYVFNITGELKQSARRRGEDIIDFGMGNPDQPTPSHIVDKLCEAARRVDTHRYSVSRGIPRLRRAICRWGQRHPMPCALAQNNPLKKSLSQLWSR